MKLSPLLLALVPLAGALPLPNDTPMFKKATPVMIVERIEPVLPFWVERLGFAKTVEVPEDDHPFRGAREGRVELMFQT
jgi:hypothetical protein